MSGTHPTRRLRVRTWAARQTARVHAWILDIMEESAETHGDVRSERDRLMEDLTVALVEKAALEAQIAGHRCSSRASDGLRLALEHEQADHARTREALDVVRGEMAEARHELADARRQNASLRIAAQNVEASQITLRAAAGLIADVMQIAQRKDLRGLPSTDGDRLAQIVRLGQDWRQGRIHALGDGEAS